MNDTGRDRRRPRLAGQLFAAAATAVLAMAVLPLLAACGGGSRTAAGPSPSPSTTAQKELAFSRCMRAHAVPNYPDPGGGGIAKESARQLGVSSSQLQVAFRTCGHLLPNTGNVDDNPVALHQWWSQMQLFSRCMHSHGVPNWPDPSPYPQDPARPTFNLHAAGIGFHQGAQPGNIVNAPQIQAEVQRCESALHQNMSGYYE